MKLQKEIQKRYLKSKPNLPKRSGQDLLEDLCVVIGQDAYQKASHEDIYWSDKRPKNTDSVKALRFLLKCLYGGK